MPKAIAVCVSLLLVGPAVVTAQEAPDLAETQEPADVHVEDAVARVQRHDGWGKTFLGEPSTAFDDARFMWQTGNSRADVDRDKRWATKERVYLDAVLVANELPFTPQVTLATVASPATPQVQPRGPLVPTEVPGEEHAPVATAVGTAEAVDRRTATPPAAAAAAPKAPRPAGPQTVASPVLPATVVDVTAYLGSWLDCNGDGYIGDKATGALVYTRDQAAANGLDEMLCAAGSVYNPDPMGRRAWIHELQWLDDTVQGLSVPGRTPASGLRVWGDFSAPGGRPADVRPYGAAYPEADTVGAAATSADAATFGLPATAAAVARLGAHEAQAATLGATPVTLPKWQSVEADDTWLLDHGTFDQSGAPAASGYACPGDLERDLVAWQSEPRVQSDASAYATLEWWYAALQAPCGRPTIQAEPLTVDTAADSPHKTAVDFELTLQPTAGPLGVTPTCYDACFTYQADARLVIPPTTAAARLATPTFVSVYAAAAPFSGRLQPSMFPGHIDHPWYPRVAGGTYGEEACGPDVAYDPYQPPVNGWSCDYREWHGEPRLGAWYALRDVDVVEAVLPGLPLEPDTDGNLLGDAWETSVATATTLLDALTDPELAYDRWPPGDGLRTWHEFRWQTVPIGPLDPTDTLPLPQLLPGEPFDYERDGWEDGPEHAYWNDAANDNPAAAAMWALAHLAPFDPDHLDSDFDGDGAFAIHDADSDGDGLSDALEFAIGTLPERADSDCAQPQGPCSDHNGNRYAARVGDHVGDGVPDGDEYAYWSQRGDYAVDYDGDGIRNNLLDADSDGDELLDDEEILCSTAPCTQARAFDTDDDGLLDGPRLELPASDSRVDVYRRAGIVSETVTTAAGAVAYAFFGERSELYRADPTNWDTDGDCVADGWEVKHAFDPSDPTDATQDADFDGLTNRDEYAFDLGHDPCEPHAVHWFGTHPRDADSDDDGLTDHDEVRVHRTDPRLEDTDLEGLTDGAEVLVHGTDGTRADTDGDGLTDYQEIVVYAAQRVHPLARNTDNPSGGVTDAYDVLDDYEEIVRFGTDPTNIDTDDDGLRDGWDPDPLTFNEDPQPLAASAAANDALGFEGYIIVREKGYLDVVIRDVRDNQEQQVLAVEVRAELHGTLNGNPRMMHAIEEASRLTNQASDWGTRIVMPNGANDVTREVVQVTIVTSALNTVTLTGTFDTPMRDREWADESNNAVDGSQWNTLYAHETADPHAQADPAVAATIRAPDAGGAADRAVAKATRGAEPTARAPALASADPFQDGAFTVYRFNARQGERHDVTLSALAAVAAPNATGALGTTMPDSPGLSVKSFVNAFQPVDPMTELGVYRAFKNGGSTYFSVAAFKYHGASENFRITVKQVAEEPDLEPVTAADIMLLAYSEDPRIDLTYGDELIRGIITTFFPPPKESFDAFTQAMENDDQLGMILAFLDLTTYVPIAGTGIALAWGVSKTIFKIGARHAAAQSLGISKRLMQQTIPEFHRQPFFPDGRIIDSALDTGRLGIYSKTKPFEYDVLTKSLSRDTQRAVLSQRTPVEKLVALVGADGTSPAKAERILRNLDHGSYALPPGAAGVKTMSEMVDAIRRLPGDPLRHRELADEFVTAFDDIMHNPTVPPALHADTAYHFGLLGGPKLQNTGFITEIAEVGSQRLGKTYALMDGSTLTPTPRRMGEVINDLLIDESRFALNQRPQLAQPDLTFLDQHGRQSYAEIKYAFHWDKPKTRDNDLAQMWRNAAATARAAADPAISGSRTLYYIVDEPPPQLFYDEVNRIKSHADFNGIEIKVLDRLTGGEIPGP